MGNIKTLNELSQISDVEELMVSMKMHKIFRKKFQTAFNDSFGDGGGDNAVPSKISVASPKFNIQPKQKPTSNGKARSISIHSKDPQSPYAGLSPQQIWKAKKLERDKLKAQQNGNGQKDKIQSPIQQNVNKEIEIDKQKQIKENELKQQQIEKEKLIQIQKNEEKKAAEQRLQKGREQAERERLKTQKAAQEAEKMRIEKLRNEEKKQKERDDAERAKKAEIEIERLKKRKRGKRENRKN